jgi:phytoene dehydrogenase-like protein
MQKRVVVVGGGLAGLCAAVYLARGGHSVTLFERRRHLGGRAITHLRHGFRLDVGPHALNRFGEAMRVFRELGIPARGGRRGLPSIATIGSSESRFPGGVFGLLTSPSIRGARAAALSLAMKLRRGSASAISIDQTVSQWLDEHVAHDGLRRVMEALVRIATWSDDATQGASLAMRQVGALLRGQTIVDEGWQRLIDALHSAAVAAGVTFVTSSRIVRVVHDGESVRGLELGELEDLGISGTDAIVAESSDSFIPKGTMLKAEDIVLAVDPATARHLVKSPEVTATWNPPSSVAITSLDVALKHLPRPEVSYAAGLDRPVMFSVPSETSHLAPGGGAMLHITKCGKGTELELETMLDSLQPGWRELVVYRRFLPEIVASNALVTPEWQRPEAKTAIRGLFLAGDWIGSDGVLSDAAASSARSAARAILAEA